MSTKTLSAAEFKTLRESVGLSLDEAGPCCGVSRRTVLNWETGKHRIPQAAAETLLDLDETLDERAEASLELALEKNPDRVLLWRYQTLTDLLAAHPDWPWPLGVHEAMLARTRKRLIAADFEVAIEYSQTSD